MTSMVEVLSDGLSLKVSSFGSRTEQHVFISNERIARLVHQRYYTSDIDGSYWLTRALVVNGFLRVDAHGHFEPTPLLDEVAGRVLSI